MIPLFKVFMSPDAGTCLNEILYSGYIGEGDQVKQFERELGLYLENPFVVTTNSCTAALRLAFRLRFKPAQKILTTPLTCFATTAAMVLEGLIPVWVDVDPNTLLMDLDSLQDRLHEDHDVAGICIVDFAGRPPDLGLIQEMIYDYQAQTGQKISVIDDAAHALGSEYLGQKLGSQYICDNMRMISCFSFQAVKSVTCGDGGALLLSSSDEAEKARRLRWYGMDRNLSREQDISMVGDKLHMNDLAATIGMSNLRHLPTIIERQKANADYYRDNLKEICIDGHYQIQSNDWLFPVIVSDRFAFDSRMESLGVHTGQVHRRNDTQPCVRQYRRSLPKMDWIEPRMSCIPVGWWVDDKQRELIVDATRKSTRS